MLVSSLHSWCVSAIRDHPRSLTRALVRIGIASLLMFPSVTTGAPWPAWRGPKGDGTTRESGFALEWSHPDQGGSNVLWKLDLPRAKGKSTPVVWGPRVFFTVQSGSGPVEGDFDVEGQASSGIVRNRGQFDLRFFVMAVHTADGSLAWASEVAPGEFLIPIGPSFDFASPSCVTDGERVYTWFGTGPVTCFTVGGEGLWQRRLEAEFAPFDVRWGHGSSPMLYKDLLILTVDHAPASYVLAVNKLTGETVWKLDLGRSGRSYATPVIGQIGRRDHLIVNWPYETGAVDPSGGKLLWTVAGLEYMMVPSPIISDGVIYAVGGLRSGPMMAIRPPNSGMATRDHVLWRHQTGGPYIASPLKVDGELYVAGETGVIRCLDVATGDVLWKRRTGQPYFASPVAAGGYLYAVDEAGQTVVLKTGREFELIAQNDLGEPTVASPALADGNLYLRTSKALYCIGNRR